MKSFKFAIAVAAVLTPVGLAEARLHALSPDAIVFLKCEDVTGVEPNGVTIQLNVNKTTWEAVSPAVTVYFPKATSGKYIVGPALNVIKLLRNQTSEVAAQVFPITPNKAKKGDPVNGTLFDSANNLKCVVN